MNPRLTFTAGHEINNELFIHNVKYVFRKPKTSDCIRTEESCPPSPRTYTSCYRVINTPHELLPCKPLDKR